MTYKEYNLTETELDKISAIIDENSSIASMGWNREANCSNAASYAKNVLGYAPLDDWTDQKMDHELQKVIRKTAFNIIKKIPLDIKKLLFLENKGSHHTSKPTNAQTWYDVLEDFYGLSDYLLVHLLSIKEANKLLQLSDDVKKGLITLEEDYLPLSKSSYIYFIG